MNTSKKNILKKLAILALVTAFTGIVFSGCEKETKKAVSSKFDKIFNNNDFVLIAEYDNETECLYGKNVLLQLNWLHYFKDSLTLNSKIYLDLDDYENAQYIFNTKDSSLQVTTLDNEIRLDNFTYHNNQLSFIGTGNNNRPVHFTLQCNSQDLKNYNEMFQQKIAPIAYLIYGAACLIAAGVDMYCDHKIQRDVANCTANGKCSIVRSCSADCVACNRH